METFLIPVIIFIFLVTTGYVLVPFMSEKVEPVGEDPAAQTTALELRKVSLYQQIREAELEREMGLIDEEDFDRTKADLVMEVAEVMRGLVTAAGTQAPPKNEGAIPGCSDCGTPIEPDARFCTNCGAAVAPPSGPRQRRGAGCPGCGAVVLPGDRFCAGCGRGLLN